MAAHAAHRHHNRSTSTNDQESEQDELCVRLDEVSETSDTKTHVRRLTRVELGSRLAELLMSRRCSAHKTTTPYDDVLVEDRRRPLGLVITSKVALYQTTHSSALSRLALQSTSTASKDESDTHTSRSSASALALLRRVRHTNNGTATTRHTT